LKAAIPEVLASIRSFAERSRAFVRGLLGWMRLGDAALDAPGDAPADGNDPSSDVAFDVFWTMLERNMLGSTAGFWRALELNRWIEAIQQAAPQNKAPDEPPPPRPQDAPAGDSTTNPAPAGTPGDQSANPRSATGAPEQSRRMPGAASPGSRSGQVQARPVPAGGPQNGKQPAVAARGNKIQSVPKAKTPPPPADPAA
jgi:hypothetical protein